MASRAVHSPVVRDSGRPVTSIRVIGESPDESAVVGRIRLGDRGAFEHVFLAYYDDMVYLARRYSGSREDAEELVQSVFAEAWRGRERLTVRAGLKVYLLGAVRHRALNVARAARVRRSHIERTLAGGDPTELACDPRGADDEAEAHELRDAVRRAMATLPERGREAVMLHVQHGLTYAEVGGIMGVSEKTVQTHVTRALRRMRDDSALRAHLGE